MGESAAHAQTDDTLVAYAFDRATQTPETLITDASLQTMPSDVMSFNAMASACENDAGGGDPLSIHACEIADPLNLQCHDQRRQTDAHHYDVDEVDVFSHQSRVYFNAVLPSPPTQSETGGG